VISTHWLDQRTPYWRRLEDLLDRVGRAGLPALTREELQELGLLYRQIAADLSTVREDPSSVRFATYLNQLLARAHNTIYSTDRPTVFAALAFFRDTFPRAFRDNATYCVIALLLFCVAAAVGVALTYTDPDFKSQMLGPRMIETIDRHEMWTHSIVGIKPLASSQIMTNNLSVCFTTFAAGITGGLGTIYMIVFNGLLIGVVAAACAASGMSLQLWSFVAPHGVLELPAIFIAGGAGLRLGRGLLFPGFLPRRESLVRAGAEAVKLIVGCVPLLMVAGIVEAFVSPTDLAIRTKFTLATALFALLVLYLQSGRLGHVGKPSDTTVVRVV
jgi:uncharacterized membrane protein SpoIIM required for sporulation